MTRRRLPKLRERWETGTGRTVIIDDIGDQTLRHRERLITLRVGSEDGARMRVLLEGFLKNYHPAGTAPVARRVPAKLPAVGELWETALGVSAEIVSVGDARASRRDRKLTARMVSAGGGMRVGQEFASSVANFLYRWSRVDTARAA